MKTVTLTGANITDDKWHTVHVNRRGNTVSLQLDYKAKAYATTGTYCMKYVWYYVWSKGPYY
jgi:hypothetical protein